MPCSENVRYSGRDGYCELSAPEGMYLLFILQWRAVLYQSLRFRSPSIQADTTVVSSDGVPLLIHPQHILPLLSEVFTNPFATAYPPLLLAALHVLRSVIIHCWPRIAHHRIEIIKGLCFCWCKTLEDDKERASDISQVQTEVKNNVRLLTAVLKREIDVAAEYRLLRRSDRRLTELLVT